ncbi:MAG: hypothetical protein R3F33_12690 [Planctomycetota bacterium]
MQKKWMVLLGTLVMVSALFWWGGNIHRGPENGEVLTHAEPGGLETGGIEPGGGLDAGEDPGGSVRETIAPLAEPQERTLLDATVLESQGGGALIPVPAGTLDVVLFVGDATQVEAVSVVNGAARIPGQC